MRLPIFNRLLLVTLFEEATIRVISKITKEDKEYGRRREGYGDP
jgi:hypothetical protein